MAGWQVAKRNDRLLIDAILHDGSFHHVSPRVLDVLLENDRVLKFKRANGWVTVGLDPVRAKKRRDDLPHSYYGPERRGTASERRAILI